MSSFMTLTVGSLLCFFTPGSASKEALQPSPLENVADGKDNGRYVTGDELKGRF